MPLKTDSEWTNRILSLKAQNPLWGAGRITRDLEREAEEKGRTDAPSQRTVARIIGKKWGPLSESERGQYRLVSWPKTFDRGDLPWEAAKATMDLLMLTFSFGEERPSVRLAQWYWRIDQVSDELPPYDCEQLARLLATFEGLGRVQELTPHVERFLACTPWLSEEDRRDYRESLKRDPIPHTGLSFTDLGAALTIEYDKLETQDEEAIQLLMDASGRRRADIGKRGNIAIFIAGMEISLAKQEEVEREKES